MVGRMEVGTGRYGMNGMEKDDEIANIAGGLVCEEVGTVAISKEKLLKECELLLS